MKLSRRCTTDGTLYDGAPIVRATLIEIHRDPCRIRESAGDFNARFKFSSSNFIGFAAGVGASERAPIAFHRGSPQPQKGFLHVSARKQRGGRWWDGRG